MTTEQKLAITSDLTSALAVLSTVPYELGELGVIVPPHLKPWVGGISIAATIILRLWKRYSEIKSLGLPKS